MKKRKNPEKELKRLYNKGRCFTDDSRGFAGMGALDAYGEELGDILRNFNNDDYFDDDNDEEDELAINESQLRSIIRNVLKEYINFSDYQGNKPRLSEEMSDREIEYWQSRKDAAIKQKKDTEEIVSTLKRMGVSSAEMERGGNDLWWIWVSQKDADTAEELIRRKVGYGKYTRNYNNGYSESFLIY